MADKVHPRYSTATDEENPDPNLNHSSTSLEVETPMSSASRPMLEKSPPPPSSGTSYVVQVPKDQIYRVPSPRAATRYQNYNRKPRRHGCCCRFLCCIFSFLIILIILLGIAALVFYLVAKPKAPSYSVDSLSIKGFNLTDLSLTSQTLSPEFDVKVSANNPNTKIGIYYESGSLITIYHDNVEFSNGTLPVFYQPTQNLTAFVVTMKGTVPLTTGLSSTLQTEESSGKIPLVLYINVPAKLKIGALKTWEFKVKVNCDIVVNSLSVNSNIVSKTCSVKVNPW